MVNVMTFAVSVVLDTAFELVARGWQSRGAKEVDIVVPNKLLTELMQIGLAKANLGWRDYSS